MLSLPSAAPRLKGPGVLDLEVVKDNRGVREPIEVGK